MSDLTTCPLCQGNRQVTDGTAPPRETVAFTPQWRVVAHRSGLSGWLLLVPRRHVTSLADLTDVETDELGPLMRAAATAQRQVADAEWSYIMEFSEGMQHHLHFSVVPRRADLPEDRRGAKVGAYNGGDEVIDDVARDELARQFQAAWPAKKESPLVDRMP